MDLEWNGATTQDGYFNEIIEIGAVALDESLTVTGEFQSFVRPKFTRRLRGRIMELTHISNDDLRGAVGFMTAFRQLKEWIGHEDDNCMLSWGNADILVLYENLKRYDMLDEIYVIRHFCDAQLLCQQAVGIPLTRQVGLSAFAETAGVEIGDDQLHRAIGDSHLAARYVARLFKKEDYDGLVQRADRVFYERMNFKSYYLQDLSDPHIKATDFMVCCPDCEVYLKRLTRYSLRNRKHYARYRCGLCGTVYQVSHAFRVTYDGLEHRVLSVPVNLSGGAEEPVEPATEEPTEPSQAPAVSEQAEGEQA